MLLQAVKRRWADYRRALRRQDQPHFDRLFEYADRHADAAGYLNTDDEMDPILFSMLLEQQKRLAQLEADLATLEAGEGTTPNPEPDESTVEHRGE